MIHIQRQILCEMQRNWLKMWVVASGQRAKHSKTIQKDSTESGWWVFQIHGRNKSFLCVDCEQSTFRVCEYVKIN